MKFAVLVFSLFLAASACAQDASPAWPNGPGGFGQRGDRGGFGGMGRGLMGTVTQVAADHYTVRTETGETYTVYFSVNTRIVKMPAGQRGPGRGMAAGEGRGGGQGMGRGGNPPEQIKPADIKVGDAITAMGEVDAAAKSVGAIVIALVDPERVKQMREMQANYGKTWIMGKVTAIDGVKVTLMGSIDNAPHAFVADENTLLRKRRDPITLADIQIGDMVRAEGALKGGVFTAATVNVMGMPPGGTPNIPRGVPPQ
jgi:hypothetical protein